MQTERTLPDWLNKDYMEEKLRSFHKDAELSVIKLWSLTASGKGENFVGIITRIYVDFKLSNGEQQQRSYLLKETCPDDAPQAAIFIEYNIYEREMDMYEFVLPTMSQLLSEAGITEKLHADALSVDREHGIIILEDLSPLNYKNADRVKKLDFEHTRLTLEMLAKFHAAAFVLDKLYPEMLAKNFNRSFYTRGVKGYTKVFTGFFKTLVRYVESQPKLKQRYHEKLVQLTDNVMEYAARCFDVDEDDFSTLIHGDCWTTNIMFQYDAKGKPVSVLPIDFQFSTRTSSTMDLHYFFNTSLQEEVFNHESELVQIYYYALKSALENLQYKGNFPTLNAFQMQFERRRFAGLLAMNFQPMMTYVGSDFSGFNDFFDSNPEAIRFQNSLYDRAEIQYIVHKMLPIFDARGLLDPQ
ncbi:uncharacterized protein LOC132787023 [Drosophila nasuta]|uniref:uncharacterized protein LOC132787023 n=1 Tax=Drosophila nasuta TaxID=42062 RepID=UPI00295F4578|nr:uncharacterized protein LOC132787023 [Drosophila nasuta]